MEARLHHSVLVLVSLLMVSL
ncbi:hypothetical protein MNBD_GAMMA13-1297, partial [hydrothermal vent metagenome]